MAMKLSEIANLKVEKRYQTAMRWAKRRTPEELRHAVATFFARQEADLGRAANNSFARRNRIATEFNRGVGYTYRGKLSGSKAAKARWEKDPVGGKIKQLVEAEWKAAQPWLGFKTKFAKEACERHPELTEPRTVLNWIKKWNDARSPE